MSHVATLPAAESQPHAAAVLGPALAPAGQPSHAYLFHGPPGSGKRAAARAFAAALLSEGSTGAAEERVAGEQAAEWVAGEHVAERVAGEHVAERVARGTHPDLTWVRPTGAAEMLVSDIDEPVVAAATRTPFEARRRVFVIEGVHTMNDRAANRLLKTLEEPPHFVHLILLANRREDVLPTILSRCQLVRFDPLSPAAIERSLLELGGRQAEEASQAEGGSQTAEVSHTDVASISPQTAAACARLALGDASLALWLAGAEGQQLRAAAHEPLAAALSAEPVARPWATLLSVAGAAGEGAGEQVAAAVQADLELLPRKERRRREREGAEAARRTQRRERTRALDLGLRLLELWLRDMLCLVEGAAELVHACDQIDGLQADLVQIGRSGAGAHRLSSAVELVSHTRMSLAQNVSEELALEALCHRLRTLLGEEG